MPTVNDPIVNATGTQLNAPRAPRSALLRAALAAITLLNVCTLGGAAGLVGCTGAASPDNGRPELAEKWFHKARNEFKDADFDDSRDSVAKALAIVPDDPQVKILAGEVALASLDYAEVIRVLKGVPGSDAARLRGRALWYKGDLDAAADELEAMLNDPDVKDEWAKATSKLARRGVGRVPFDIKGGLLGAVEMVVVSPVAPYFVVPVEIDGESALAMIATGTGEVVVDSATRPEPSWVSLRFDHLEVRDVPALPQDLSGISKEIGAPIKAMIGVNLLRHLNATFDFSGHQFVVRSFVPPPPPHATRLDPHYARGGGMIVRSTLGAEGTPQAALMVDTHRPFALAVDDAGWKKAGIDPTTLKLITDDPQQKLREGEIPLMHLGAFDLKHVIGISGIPLTDLQKATGVDLDGIIGAGLLYRYRCTFADGGRVLWIEDDFDEMQRLLAQPRPAAPPAPPPGAPLAPAGGLAPKPGSAVPIAPLPKK